MFRGAKVGIILQILQKYSHKKHFYCTKGVFLCINNTNNPLFYISALQKLLFPVGTFSLQMVKDNFSDAHAFGCHLHILVSLDVFQ